MQQGLTLTSRQQLMTHWKETMGTPEARHWIYFEVRQWVLEMRRRVVGVGLLAFFFIFWGVFPVAVLLPCSARMISASEYLLRTLPPPRRTWATMYSRLNGGRFSVGEGNGSALNPW